MRNHLLKSSAVAASLWLGAAASAAAQPPWTAPAPFGGPGASPALRGAVQLVGNDAGLAIAVAAGGGAPGDISPRTVASVYTDGAFGDPLLLGPSSVNYGPRSGQVGTYAKTRLLAAGIDVERDSSRAVFAFGRLTPGHASLGEPRPLGPPKLHANGAALAVNDAGDAAMVYAVCRDAGCRRALVYLAVRRHGTSSISSTRLFDGSGPLPRVAAAVNARGDALAVWTTADDVRARVRTLGGRLRPTQRVGPIARGTTKAPSAALSRHRAELVGWLSQAIGEGQGGPGIAYVAQARDGGDFSTPARLADVPALEGAGYVGGAGVRVAFDPLGRRLVMWTGYEGGRFVVRSAEVHGAANSGTAIPTDRVLVSDPAVDSILSDMEVAPDGQQAALIDAGVRGDEPAAAATTIEAALRPRGGVGAFRREPISDGTTQARDADGAIAGNDRVVAAWATLAGNRFSQWLGVAGPELAGPAAGSVDPRERTADRPYR